MVNLTKGEKVNLTKESTGLQDVVVKLGWNVNKYEGGDFDLDASAVLVGENGKVKTSKDFVFYGNKADPNGAVSLDKDDRDGRSDGETIKVNLSKVPHDVKEIVFVVSIYEAISKLQNFGMVEEAYINIIDGAAKNELAKFDLDEDYSSETAMVMGKLYRHNGDWKFAAVGSGFSGGLEKVCEEYGI